MQVPNPKYGCRSMYLHNGVAFRPSSCTTGQLSDSGWTNRQLLDCLVVQLGNIHTVWGCTTGQLSDHPVAHLNVAASCVSYVYIRVHCYVSGCPVAQSTSDCITGQIKHWTEHIFQRKKQGKNGTSSGNVLIIPARSKVTTISWSELHDCCE